MSIPVSGQPVEGRRSAGGADPPAAVPSFTFAHAAERTYEFPAPLADAFAWHRRVGRLLALLPSIEVVDAAPDGRYRLRYHATEAGRYRVSIVCDVRARVDERRRELSIVPVHGARHAPLTAGPATMCGYGEYEHRISFHPLGERTRIVCRMRISATLPVAGTLRLLPAALLRVAATRRLRRRLNEIVRVFTERLIREFRR